LWGQSQIKEYCEIKAVETVNKDHCFEKPGGEKRKFGDGGERGDWRRAAFFSFFFALQD
jgi:hypothetical protein